MKTVCLMAVWMTVMIGIGQAAERTTLKIGSWLCVSPDAYDQAVVKAKNRYGKARQDLIKELRDDQLCLYADDELLEDMMAPWVQVLEQQDGKVKVSFMVEFYRRVEFLHRRFSRVNYTGWTDAGNLTELPFVSR